MVNDWNNVKPVGCKPWLVLPAVYSEALSYGDQIAHFCAALNKLIQNNNTLPEYIQQMIQDYINGDVIGEVVQNIVSQFILNVKYPPENLKPAVGDGSADDTEAIQGCINYAKNHNGMAVYIPSGAYSVQSLTLPGDVSLFGFDRYTTKLVLRGGATTPMISSTGTGFSIVGLTLDGNAGIQVENINVLSLISQDVLLRDLIVQNGYKLLVYNGTAGHLQVNDVVFGSAVYDCVEISGGSIVQFDNCQFTALSQVSGQHVIDISSDAGVYNFVNSAVCPVCCVVNGNDNYIEFSSVGAKKNFSDTGLRNSIVVRGQESKEYLSGDLNSTIEGSYGQNINGAFSENISGAYTSVRNSTESKTVTKTSIKNYNDSQTENVTNKKTINAKDIYLNPTNPLQYKKPKKLNLNYNYIEFKDDTDTYKVLVENNTNTLINVSTVLELKELEPNIGDVIITRGYYGENDGGSGIYVISNEEANNFDIIQLKSNTAKLINFNNLNQLGAKANDDTFDNSEIINFCVNKYDLSTCYGEYYVNNTITLNKSTNFNRNLKLIFNSNIDVGININSETEGLNFKDLYADFNSKCDIGVLITNCSGSNFRGFELYNAKNCLMQVGNKINEGTAHVFFSDMHLYNFSTLAKCMEIYATDCAISNSELYYTNNAILLHAEMLTLNNNHLWAGNSPANSIGILCDNTTAIRLLASCNYTDNFEVHIESNENNLMLIGSELTFMGSYQDIEQGYCISCGPFSILNVTNGQIVNYSGKLYKLKFNNATDYFNVPTNHGRTLILNNMNLEEPSDLGNNICLVKSTPIKTAGKQTTQSTTYRIGYLIPSNITSCVPINIGVINQGLTGTLEMIYYNSSSANITYTGDKIPVNIIIGKPITAQISGIGINAIPIGLKFIDSSISTYDFMSCSVINDDYGCLILHECVEDNTIVTLSEKALNSN